MENITTGAPALLKSLRVEAFKRGQASIITLLNSAIVTTQVPTMATDGKRVYINNDWANSIGPQKAIGVLVHELLHDIFEHSTRPWAKYRGEPLLAEGKWRQLVNVAMDIIINDIVLSKGYQLPEGGQFRKNLGIPDNLKTSHQVFIKLLDDYKTNEQKRRDIEEIMQKLEEEENAKSKLITLPKVNKPKPKSQPKSQPKPQPKPQPPTQKDKDKDKEKDKDKISREQLITKILQDQTLYGGF